MKKIVAILFSICLMLSLFASCKNSNDEAQKEKDTQEMIQSAQKDGDIQPNAQVTTGRDENGNATFHYTNPDGSGGGGVAFD